MEGALIPNSFSRFPCLSLAHNLKVTDMARAEAGVLDGSAARTRNDKFIRTNFKKVVALFGFELPSFDVQPAPSSEGASGVVDFKLKRGKTRNAKKNRGTQGSASGTGAKAAGTGVAAAAGYVFACGAAVARPLSAVLREPFPPTPSRCLLFRTLTKVFFCVCVCGCGGGGGSWTPAQHCDTGLSPLHVLPPSSLPFFSLP